MADWQNYLLNCVVYPFAMTALLAIIAVDLLYFG